jgi:PAS domain S-box-containing protein
MIGRRRGRADVTDMTLSREGTAGTDDDAGAGATAVSGEEDGGSGTDRGARLNLDLLNAIRDYAIFSLDENGVIMSWSPGAERLTGYTPDDAIGQSYDVFGTQGGGGIAGMLGVVHEANCLQQERWWRRRDGRLVWVDELINPLDGRGFVVIARDLTERVEAEERQLAASRREAESAGRETALRSELQAAERRASFLVEASSILVATALDFDSTIRALARLAVSRISDWCVIHSLEENGSLVIAEIAHRDPAVERQLADAVAADPHADWTGMLHSVISTTQPQILEPPGDGGWFGGDGEQQQLLRELSRGHAMITPLMGRGRVLGSITFIGAGPDRLYDEDDLALAEELGRRAAIALDNARLYREAQEANRAKADFLAVISHELRTPLNAIMGYSDLLDARISGDLTAKQRRQIDRIRASARHLLQLIEEILSFARIEAGGEEVHVEPIDAADVAREAAAGIESMARAKGLTFRMELPERPLMIETDLGKARQALVNVLSNAVKFTDEGSVTLRLRQLDGRVVYEVADTGVGIPSQQLDRIFDPFWQAERPNTRRVGGTGLGLAVSRRYVRLLRGDLEIDSEPGRGTRVCVTLPLKLTGSGGT